MKGAKKMHITCQTAEKTSTLQNLIMKLYVMQVYKENTNNSRKREEKKL